MSWSSPSTPETAKLANVDNRRLSTNQQTLPLPYFWGRRWFAGFHIISRVYNYRATKKSAGGGKGGKGSQTQTLATCDIAILMACGPADFLEAIEVNNEIVWSAGGGITRGGAHPEHTGNIVVPNVGTFRLHWGTSTASGDWIVLNSGIEEHPYYRDQIVLEVQSLNCGSSGSLPQIRVLLERAPSFGTLDGGRSREGANAITGLCELIENDFYGLSRGGLIDQGTAEVLAAAHAARTLAVAVPGDPSHVAQMAYCSAFIDGRQSFAAFASGVLEMFDGWARRKGEQLEFGQFSHGAIDTSGLPELTLHDLYDEPTFPNPGIDASDVITDAIVNGLNRDIGMEDDWDSYPNEAARDRLKENRPKTFARPFLHTRYQLKEQAQQLVQFYAWPAAEATNGWRRAKVGALQPGDRFIVNYSPSASRQVFRVKRRSDPARGGRVKLTIENERGIAPLPYLSAPDNPPGVPPPLTPSTIVNARIFQAPPAWAGPQPFVIPLAARPSAACLRFNSHFSTDDASYDLLAQDLEFALSGTLVGSPSNSAATVTVQLGSLELDTLIEQSDPSQEDNTLLLFVGNEVLSIGSVTAIGGGQYTLGVLRGRLGSAAAAHTSGDRVYIQPRAECVLLEHAGFPRQIENRYFKFAAYTNAETEELATALKVTFTFANRGVSAPTSFVSSAQVEGINITVGLPADRDLSHVEFWVRTTNTPPVDGDVPDFTFALPPNAAGGKWAHLFGGIVAGATRYFTARLVDTIGEESDFTATISSTASAPAPGAPGANNATIFIYKRAASTPALPTATTTYTFATGVLTGLNNGWTQAVPAADGNPLYVSAVTASNTAATDSIAASEWAAPVLLVQDGAAGSPGTNNATVFIYKRASSPPALPSASTTYTFATGLLTGLNNGWSQNVPASDGNPLYVGVATASSPGVSDTIAPGEWASPVILAQDGTSGAAGLNVASVFLYKRASSPPAVPSSTATYTFATGVLTGHNNGWSQQIPDTDGNPCYVISATAGSTGPTDTITSGEWASPTRMVQDGASGAAGVNSASVFIYKRASSTPALPSGTTTYTFATGALTGLDNGWSQSIPAADGNPLYVATATAISAGSTDSIGSGEWAAPQILAQDGAPGGAAAPAPGVLRWDVSTVRISAPASPPSGYWAQYSIDGGSPSAPATSLPFFLSLTMGQELIYWAGAPGYTQSAVGIFYDGP